MNVLDLITVGIVLVCIVIGYVKGLLLTVFNLVSLVVSFLLTRQFYPVVSDWLMGTPLYAGLQQAINGWIGSGTAVPDTGHIVADTVNNMSLPDIFKTIIMDNIGSLPDLDLTGVYDYVSGYAAKLAVDAISILLVFVAVFLLMRIIAIVLRLVSKMPVVRTFNHIGGGVLGFLAGGLLSWLVLIVMNGIFAANTEFPVTDLLAESMIAKYFMLKL